MHCRRCSFFFEISCVISNWYATRSSNNTTIYMDLGESSTFFRIRCLEFYFPRHSVASLSLSLFFLFSPDLSFPLLSLSLPRPHYFSFSFSPLGSHSLASMPRIALLGISEVLSRIQGLASSLMDGSAILFHSTPPPPRTYHPSPECCSTPSPRYLFAHSMGDYTVSEFTHSRKVRASRDILRVIAPC